MATVEAQGGQTGLRLGGARADFVAGLGRKVSDLRGTAAKVREAPADLPRREELRRKMHALSSAAKLMKFDAMDRAIAEALGTIDRSAIDMPLEEVDLASIEQVLEDLPALAWGDGDARVSRVEPVAKPAPNYAALVVGSAQIAEALLEEPSSAFDTNGKHSVTFACESTPDAQAAFDLARATEPDLVVIDADLDCAVELVEALMDEPLTEGAPIIVVGSFLEAGEASRYVAMGVAKTLSKPTSKSTLRYECERALEARAASLPRIALLGTPSSSPGPSNDVAFGDRARVRLRGPAAEVRLQGRKVVVADDDPAVVWFLADLLKTHGCVVHEAFDGKQAMELVYRTSPDLIVCDIMMPELDGFTLCRALRRDVALHDVPVILLSWKEDLLQRTRELGAGAAGYIRKESDTRAILARVREALRPRARIEMRLRDDGEVRGRVDGLSVRALLEIVCATRPEARVSVRDASFNYEVEIRDGAPQRATRTTGDGTVLEGSRVLAALLGVSAGRFTVSTSALTVEAHLDGNLAAQLARPIARARAATTILTGASSIKANLVVLDEDLLDDYLRAMPQQARTIALRIANGATPRTLLLQGACPASLVEDIVCDLASRGIVTAIEDDMGTDILGPEIARFAAHADARAAYAPRTATPAPLPAGSCATEATSELCESPEPGDVRRARAEEHTSGDSLEDAVLSEIAFRSPEPAPLGLPLDKPMLIETSTLKARTSPPPPSAYEEDDDGGTPTHSQMLALAEPTLIDNTTYAERETAAAEEAVDEAIPVDEASEVLAHSESRAAKTPLTAVTTRDEIAARPAKRKAWPMVAFVAATGIVAWAVLHFTPATADAPRTVEVAPPPAHAQVDHARGSEEITYTNVPAEADVATGQGLLEVSAAGDAVILVDGIERGRGSAKLSLWAGSHDVRISGAEGDKARPAEVRAGQVAHLKL
jgi:DNA-binding response OmpR family regulator